VKHLIIRSKLTLIVALVAMLVGVLLGAFFHKETVVVREGTPDTPAAMSSVNLMVDHGDGTIKTWNTVSWHESMSVMNLLETVAGAKGIVFLTKPNKKGELGVESIDGYMNATKGTTTMRWQYWINNTYEPRIASKYYMKPGDMVMWKYVVEQPKL
jgi:predicted dehydrogenase